MTDLLDTLYTTYAAILIYKPGINLYYTGLLFANLCYIFLDSGSNLSQNSKPGLILMANSIFALLSNVTADITPMKKKFSVISKFYLGVWNKLVLEFERDRIEYERLMEARVVVDEKNKYFYDEMWENRGMESISLTYLVAGDFYNS